MTTIAQLMRASPVWWDYTKADEGGRIEQLPGRMKCRLIRSTRRLLCWLMRPMKVYLQLHDE